MQISYRLIRSKEYQFLEEMLYEALFVPSGKPKFPKSVINNPGISKYVENWNLNTDDIAIVAIKEKELIGAIWGRKFQMENKGYGYVDSETPEISMAVKEKYRNKGIGTKLLEQIEKEYLQIGANALSLSVDKLSPAKELYKRRGYRIHKEEGTAITMIKRIKKDR